MHHDPSPSATTCRAPSRHRQALLTFVGLVAPVTFIPPAVASVLPLGRPAVVLASLALIVPLMSYGILPALQWLVRIGESALARESATRLPTPASERRTSRASLEQRALDSCTSAETPFPRS